jgi:phospholipase C
MRTHITEAARASLVRPASTLFAAAVCAATLFACSERSLPPEGDFDTTVDAIPTATPIKHLIIIVGENRSFDHLFATYVQQHPGEGIHNLLSEGIVDGSGHPGPNFALAHQYQITAPPNGGKYWISADLAQKTLYTTLPPPDLNGIPPISPYVELLAFPGGDPGLPPQDQYLLGTGGTDLIHTYGPDTRITNVTDLPPGPFQETGPDMSFDAFTGDTTHIFFTMWQQADCATDSEHVSTDNPTGCLHDLLPAVTTTWSTPPGGIPHDTGQNMAFYNMQQGDAPVFKSLADQFTISDNYHQPVMGGTAPDSLPLGFADQIFYSNSQGQPATPAAENIYDPDPVPGSLNLYTNPFRWFDCSDVSHPGIAAIANYLTSLASLKSHPYTVKNLCGPGEYWMARNTDPAFTPTGLHASGLVQPPTTQRSIGDVLTANKIPWKYYGGGFNDADTLNPLGIAYCNICNPFEYQARYPEMVADHMRDVTDLFADIVAGTLPAVAYVKPDGVMDGHPASSKWSLFEAFVSYIIFLAQQDSTQWSEIAILITVDESGGFYDSGFIQPVDFFGTGPRIPMIAVSPFSTGGHVSHVYNEHSSVVKFIERNWKLGETLSSRSRDNLPNPMPSNDSAYVPSNMPAIGDLFDLFSFP